ncbi:bifunctional indole-3-glycerol phosphate synthase/phosphoribosylanthranilate isomerase [Mergibacter septicus]|uniref:bifunctional indole-3-glycerol-phosphate synthase TrpC/phosphoribosylanthranilate isomerase TrpF n=1 Tax=Mergibacter septicus TaxID=221402 RepID=UPI0011795AAC|nr:bifunctional indole-3-glycerol-phosphate synthase TrpC/phosphoribosylanthranilate isomerase TrpF [Mergibacter septicus]AWX13313.1 bifunctional indole-3-glycerol phosphate synthase/phosphoribosylanthranilate isomerase [Mergibacter septicus]
MLEIKKNLTGQATVLQRIIQDKLEWLEKKQQHLPLQHLQAEVTKSDRCFYTALAENSDKGPAFILECKKASPSKGTIRVDFDIEAIAEVYKNYATVISVLTDEKYFQGNFNFIQQVRKIAQQPILCKDFILSEYQIYLARYYQADAVLLMLSVLDDKHYLRLAELAHSLSMGVLTEVSNQAELDRAIKLNAKVIGINNRNLHDLTTDLTRTPPLASQIPTDRIIISESGIYTHQQVRYLQPYVHGFLVGSSLMVEQDLALAVRKLIFGENKVCGLTLPQNAIDAYQVGAVYGGLIFAEKSPRKLNLSQAQEIVAAAPLQYVGVFQNQTVDEISYLAARLPLVAVQLHGEEDQAFVDQLRLVLNDTCQIWKAVSVNVETVEDFEMLQWQYWQVDRYVFDSQVGSNQGGTGQQFDWVRLPQQDRAKIMLAGGLKLENIRQAVAQNCLGLDINSGAEQAVGIKDPIKLKAIFTQILTRQ